MEEGVVESRIAGFYCAWASTTHRLVRRPGHSQHPTTPPIIAIGPTEKADFIRPPCELAWLHSPVALGPRQGDVADRRLFRDGFNIRKVTTEARFWISLRMIVPVLPTAARDYLTPGLRTHLGRDWSSLAGLPTPLSKRELPNSA